MSDVVTQYHCDDGLPARFDWVIDISPQGSRIGTASSLHSLVINALFSNRRAHPDQIIKGIDRQGWWAEYLMNGRRWGSRLWTLRGKAADTTPGQAEHYVNEALQHLIDDGVAERIETEAQWLNQANGQLAMSLAIYEPDNLLPAYQQRWRLDLE